MIAFVLAVVLWPVTASAAVPGGGLQAHETAGGHLIARHVGKDKAFLQRRLDDEGVPAASTFATAAAADKFVSAALTHNNSAITSWLAGKAARLVITYTSTEVTGQSLRPGAAAPTNVHGVRLVLQRAPAMSCKYRIVTGYPEGT
jgi:sarcosine oxidase gamma subunit